uniref:Uncharacterized protein n=1 Tax=Romanomermis culicivorax TaxID=13658 RepID=A0A915JTQ0_ROMCU
MLTMTVYRVCCDDTDTLFEEKLFAFRSNIRIENIIFVDSCKGLIWGLFMGFDLRLLSVRVLLKEEPASRGRTTIMKIKERKRKKARMEQRAMKENDATGMTAKEDDDLGFYDVMRTLFRTIMVDKGDLYDESYC